MENWNEVEDSNDNSGSDEESKNEKKQGHTGRRQDDLEFYQKYGDKIGGNPFEQKDAEEERKLEN